MYKSMFILLFSLVCLSGYALAGKIETHELLSVDINRHDTNVSGWLYADLKGDETDYLISTDASAQGVHSIYITDPKGKVVSQLNGLYPFNSMKVLPDPRDNGRWLFYTHNDGKNVYLDAAKYNWQVPLQQESKSFQSIPRHDSAIDNPKIGYGGQVIPQILDDIDSDGRMELVCIGADGFTANPRGLVVYDFITGAIKWQYLTPCNLTGVQWQDFDMDGSKELVFGTCALKNTLEVINGIDDTSGWIVVLAPSGKLLYQERQFGGFGQVNLDIADREQDGKLELYAVNTTWGNETIRNTVAVFNWTGSLLQRKLSLQMPSSLERMQFNDYLKRMAAEGTRRLHLVDRNKGLIVLDENLRIIPHKYHDSVKSIWAIADLNQDGNREILLQTDDNYIEVLDMNYKCRARIKSPFSEETSFSLSIVKTGVDSDPLVSLGTNREVRYYHYRYMPITKYFYSAFKGYAVYINLLLIAVLGFMIYRYKRRMLVMRVTANQMKEGLIILTNAWKIAFRNPTAYALADKSNDPACKNLKFCFPALYISLCKFIESNMEQHAFIEDIGEAGKQHSYHIGFSHTRNLKHIYMITITPVHEDAELVKDKLQWADIARRLSHHVRRHITNIMLALDVLQKDTDSNRQEYYQIISSEIEKVRVFTHSFQRFTEMKDYDLKLQDIVPSVEHCLARTVIPDNVKLVKSWNLHSIPAYIEPIRFEEAVVNSINNSLEAMSGGGTLHITLKEFPLVAAQHGSLTILVEIEDSGCGIPAKYMEDIWRPFFTTKQSGTGIGIPETKKIIDSLGGVMHIHSEEGIGTTVSFWLKGEK